MEDGQFGNLEPRQLRPSLHGHVTGPITWSADMEEHMFRVDKVKPFRLRWVHFLWKRRSIDRPKQVRPLSTSSTTGSINLHGPTGWRRLGGPSQAAHSSAADSSEFEISFPWKWPSGGEMLRCHRSSVASTSWPGCGRPGECLLVAPLSVQPRFEPLVTQVH